eukprot:3639465-Amphidinium_carterae.2
MPASTLQSFRGGQSGPGVLPVVLEHGKTRNQPEHKSKNWQHPTSGPRHKFGQRSLKTRTKSASPAKL